MPSRARWQRMWRALNGAPPAGLYDALVARYREPPRCYHTLAHLDYCLARFDAARAAAARPAEVELALWFHDAVYDSRRSDNEARSAAWARAALEAAGMPADVGARVQGLILATRHEEVPRDADARLLADVDLAILGDTPERFDDYERRIRQEYAWMPAAEFRAGRSALLRRLLARGRIYATPYFHERRERRARANLGKSLARLTGEGAAGSADRRR